MNEVKARAQTIRKEYSRIWHQRASITEHASVLQHRVHLRYFCSPEVVRQQEIVDRQSATEDVAAHDEVQLPPERDWTVRRIYDRHLSPWQSFLDSLQNVLERGRLRESSTQLIVSTVQA